MSADRVEIGNCIIAGIAEGGTCLEQMSEIVTRLELAGYVIMPREPTQEMIAAAEEAREAYSSYTFRDVFCEMVRAAVS